MVGSQTAALRPDNRKLHPHAVISWELPGFALRRADDGRLIEGLYQGIKKRGSEFTSRQRAFPPVLWPLAKFSRLKAEQPLRLAYCGSLITEVLAPASAVHFCVEERDYCDIQARSKRAEKRWSQIAISLDFQAVVSDRPCYRLEAGAKHLHLQ